LSYEFNEKLWKIMDLASVAWRINLLTSMSQELSQYKALVKL